MKKLLSLLLMFLLAFSLALILAEFGEESKPISQGGGVSQGEGTNTISPSLYAEKMGFGGLVYIGRGLYYDSSTMIVYWWNGYFGGVDQATAPTAYYAPNGMPYRYNPSTNTFEEIKD